MADRYTTLSSPPSQEQTMHPADYRHSRASTTSTRKKAELSLSAPREATEAPTARRTRASRTARSSRRRGRPAVDPADLPARHIGGLRNVSYGAYRDRTGDLRLAKLCAGSRPKPGWAGITGREQVFCPLACRNCRVWPGPSGDLVRDVCGMSLLSGCGTSALRRNVGAFSRRRGQAPISTLGSLVDPLATPPSSGGPIRRRRRRRARRHRPRLG